MSNKAKAAWFTTAERALMLFAAYFLGVQGAERFASHPSLPSSVVIFAAILAWWCGRRARSLGGAS